MLTLGAVAALLITSLSGCFLPAPTPAPPPTPVETWSRPADGMVMVYVPAGEFIMGSPDGEGYDQEHPQHRVYLDAYWIDRTEVSNAQYRQCVDAGTCEVAPGWMRDDMNDDEQPVAGVTWYDAHIYCEWADARLPTEAEWEKAARGTDGRTYPWGNSEPDCTKANYWDKENGCLGIAAAVGSYPAGASPYGALNMAGNMWEWVADWYDKYYYGNSPARNPQGPDSGEERVLRGASFMPPSYMVRCAYRNKYNPTYMYGAVGFRCARSSENQ